jgi:hypothetical protein
MHLANLFQIHISLLERSSFDVEWWLLPARKRADIPRTRRIIKEMAIKMLLMICGLFYVNVEGVTES